MEPFTKRSADFSVDVEPMNLIKEEEDMQRVTKGQDSVSITDNSMVE